MAALQFRLHGLLLPGNRTPGWQFSFHRLGTSPDYGQRNPFHQRQRHLHRRHPHRTTVVRGSYPARWSAPGNRDCYFYRRCNQLHHPDEPAEEMEALTTEYYSFTEQADYLPIFVETDSTSDIQEIAVLAGDEVVGAGVRLAGDTLVEVNAYLEGVPAGTPLEFETWSGYKSQPVQPGDYTVQNRNTRNYEKRVVYKGERAKYHLVSLKAGQDALISQCVSDATCSPNPFSRETLFSFRLNTGCDVNLAIYDLAGNRIHELLNSELPAGYYEVVWDGRNTAGIQMQNGIYVYKLIAGNGNEISGKVVLIK